MCHVPCDTVHQHNSLVETPRRQRAKGRGIDNLGK